MNLYWSRETGKNLSKLNMGKKRNSPTLITKTAQMQCVWYCMMDAFTTVWRTRVFYSSWKNIQRLRGLDRYQMEAWATQPHTCRSVDRVMYMKEYIASHHRGFSQFCILRALGHNEIWSIEQSVLHPLQNILHPSDIYKLCSRIYIRKYEEAVRIAIERRVDEENECEEVTMAW